MSSYSYSSLPASGEDIRLLRLLPSEDEAAPLHCELRDYSLRRSTPRTHLYEAISYVWGDPHNTLPIYVDKKQFQVTVNLHAALLCLRDHSFERILWVDAICINQNNNEERRQQVQFMARIYNSASRVVVWLGEEIEEIEGALEDIQVASNEEPGKNSKEVVKKEHIIKLLKNPWFQRIWVLQEVAAAQHVVIMCGSITIGGSAFCMGVKSLGLSYTDSPELQTLPPVIDLIERAGLQPKFKAKSRETFSLNMRSLAELIDMFHTRQATDRRDKIYALLGMSSDDPENSDLQPNYETPWEEIFQRAIKLILGKDISLNTSSQRAMFQCKGFILGQVSTVKRDNRQHVSIEFRFEARDLGKTVQWDLQASAIPIEEHDIICLLYRASKPSIIRLCEDHFAVVVIAATPLDRESHIEWPQLSQSKIRSLRDILLVWDWESSFGKIQDGREYKSLTKKFSQVSVFSREESGGYLEKAIRLWNDIAILDDLQERGEADERLIGAQDEYYLAAFGEMPSSYESIDTCGRTILAFAVEKGHGDIVKLLLNTIHPDVRDGKTGCRALSLAAKNGHEAIVKLLLATGLVDADSKDYLEQTPLLQAAEMGHENIVKLLLATGQVDTDSKDYLEQTPLLQAAQKGHENIVKLLLANSPVDADSKDYWKRTPLSYAAREGHEMIVKLLLATGQVDADSKDYRQHTPLSYAAREGYEMIVKLLLATGQVDADSKDYWKRTPLSRAAQKGHEAVVKLLLLLPPGQVEVDSKDVNGGTPLSLAAFNGHEAVVKLLLATDLVDVDLEDRQGRTPLFWAADNGHEAVVELLHAAGQRYAESGEEKTESDVDSSDTSVYESNNDVDY